DLRARCDRGRPSDRDPERARRRARAGAAVSTTPRTAVTTAQGAAARDVTLAIEGMTCASCVRTVERALAKVPGVTDASVNLATETARVRGDAMTVDALVRSVREAGYGARERFSGQDDRERAARVAELASTRRRLVV